MQRRNRFAGLLAAILVGSLIAVGVQAFTGMGGQSEQPAQYEEIDVEPSQPEVFVPKTPYPTAKPLEVTIVVGSPMPTPIVVGDPVPTAPPMPTAALPPSLAADETVVYENDFSTDDLSGWEYAQLFDDPLPAPAWTVRNDEHVTEALMAPENRDAMTIFNNMMALPPVTLDGDGAIEANIRSGSANRIGLLLGYLDNQNYTAMIFGDEDARTRNGPVSGLMLVQVTNGETTVLAHNTQTVMQRGQWYSLRLEVTGSTVTAFVDNGKALTATLPDALAGQQVGLYAGSDGFVYFDNVRAIEK